VADIRVTRQAFEVLRSSASFVRSTKQAVEAAYDGSAVNVDSNVRVTRQAIESVRGSAPKSRLTKQAYEAAYDGSAVNLDANVVVTRQGLEVIRTSNNPAKITKQAFEAAYDGSAVNVSAAVRVVRQAIEVLASRRVSGISPLADPSGLFLFPHNWANEVELRTTWLTDIVSSQDTGCEERRALLATPNRAITFRWLQNEPDAMVKLRSMLRRIPSERVIAPLYQDLMELTSGGIASLTLPCDTTNRRITVGQRVAIFKLESTDRSRVETMDLRRVTYIDPAYLEVDSPTSFALDPSDTVVLPTMDVEVNLESGKDLIVEWMGDAEVELEEVIGPSALLPTDSGMPNGAPVFRGAPVWTIGFDWATPPELRFVREGRKFTQGRGMIVDKLEERHRTHIKFQSGPLERADFWPILNFFDACRGRCRSFWMPDPEANYTVLASAGAGAFIDVEPLGDFADFTAEMDYVDVIFKDGTHYTAQVVDIQQTLGIWRITVQLGDELSFNASDVLRLARLRRMRFNSDELIERWKTAYVAETELEMTEVLDESEVTT
jgi:hypothetical protein